VNAFDLGLYKIFVEKTWFGPNISPPVMVFWLILVAIPFLNYSFHPNLQKNKDIPWVELLRMIRKS
jgi:hypothetical protein